MTMDKPDIIDLATQIGTEPFARTMPEYCGVISNKPSINASIDEVEAAEQDFNFSVLEEALEQLTVTAIQDIAKSSRLLDDIEVVNTPGINDIVIDIRHPDEIDEAPLALTNNAIQTIPFYKLSQAATTFDPKLTYLLYCQRGTMSQLHAQQLKAQGFNNIKVYRQEVKIELKSYK